MTKAKVMFGMIGASLLCVGAGAVELPAGPNKDMVARACGSCHDLDMVFDAAGQTREGWNGDERAQILEYLVSFLGPEAKRPR